MVLGPLQKQKERVQVASYIATGVLSAICRVCICICIAVALNTPFLMSPMKNKMTIKETKRLDYTFHDESRLEL